MGQCEQEEILSKKPRAVVGSVHVHREMPTRQNYGESFSGKLACFCTSPKSLCTNAHSIGNRRNYEVCMQLENYDLTGIRDTGRVAHTNLKNRKCSYRCYLQHKEDYGKWWPTAVGDLSQRIWGRPIH